MKIKMKNFFKQVSLLNGLGQSIAFTVACSGFKKLCILKSELSQSEPNYSFGFVFGIFSAFLQLGLWLKVLI